MFVDLWVLSLFSILFGICAVWNHKRGYYLGNQAGIAETLVTLSVEKFIKVRADGKVALYNNPKQVSKYLHITGLDINQ